MLHQPIGSDMSALILERVMRHDRAVVVVGLLLVLVLSWAYLLAGAGTLQDMGDMLMPMSAGPWTLRQAIIMLVMWAVMMVAMMLPGAAPMILLYAVIARGHYTEGKPASMSGFFAGGYVLVWSAFSVGAVALQFALEKASILSPMMKISGTTLAGAVLIAAGLYQWTPLKQACLKHCRSPLEFVLMRWRDGAGGAFLMGVEHGSYCVGCCWALMLLLFVGGLMNMAWVAGIALFVLLEKIVPGGHWMGRFAGVVLIGWGVTTLLLNA